MRRSKLSPKNRAIYDALLASYHGDYLQVLRHVRIERFEISHRYRTGWVTVEIGIAPVKPGSLQVYWPEGNVLIGRRLDPASGEPDYNATVRVVR